MSRIAQDFLACLLVLVLLLTGLAQGVHAARAPDSAVICGAAGPVEIPLPGGDADRMHCPECLPQALAAVPPAPLRGPDVRRAAMAWQEPRTAVATGQPGVTTIRGPPGERRA
jgi:hypothetical protein